MNLTLPGRMLAILLLALAAGSAQGRDWFVRAGSTGDGSQASPFGDPYEALEKCEAGDAIHIAQGRYFGKLQAGQWAIAFDNISLVGGYSADFAKRDPWNLRTELVYDKNSKNRPKDARVLSQGRNTVLDGLVIDMAEQNKYDTGDKGRTPDSLDVGKEAVYLWLPSTVRNCMILNTGREAVVCRNGTTIENNLFLNVFDSAVKVVSLPPANPDSKIPAVIRKNTFAWSWCDRSPGKGRYSGAGIQMSGHANITGNIFAHCDNNAVYCTVNPDRSSITGNVFSMNLWSNFKMFIEGRDVVVDDKTMELMEETGLKAFEGNDVKSPGLPFDQAWVDGAAKRTSAVRGKVEMDDWNKFRQTMGLNLEGTGAKGATGLAPAYPLDKAVALLAPKDAALKAGARILPLEAKFTGGPLAGPAKAYEKSEITSWARDAGPVDGKALEMVVAASSVANINGIPAQYKKDDHEGIVLHDRDGNVRVTGFYRKGSAVNRAVNEAAGRYNGSGKAERLYVVKGTAHVVQNIPKAGFHIESFTPLEAAGVVRVRAKGRDWFVRAGAAGGDGSREKPFRDPFQPLERCEAGDTIHVTGGEYVGKLRGGTWKVDSPDITLLGGYDKDFTARDPWANPTLLHCPADFKGRRGGYTLEGDADHTGCVVDGFVFDKRFNNQYDNAGDLMVKESDKTEHLWLARPGCVVRNCVFVNGAMGAVRMTAAQTIENCIFMNHQSLVVSIQRGYTPRVPLVFKDNTLAFSWEKRFGFGHGLVADLLVMDGDVCAVVENNIFEFADQHAIRINGSPKDVELANNVFAHNLWAEVYLPGDSLVVDNKAFDNLRQLGFKRLEGNALMVPGLAIDPKWFDVYLKRTAFTPGKVQMDDWNKLRELTGQPLIAAGTVAGTGLAPMYDYKKAVAVFPANPLCKAGARPRKLEVKFDGVARASEEREYAESSWDAAKSAADWDKLQGKRVSLKVVINRDDNQYTLDDAKKDTHSAWMVSGPAGSESGGLPMRVYVPLGTRLDRVFRQAKGYSSGLPAETHVIKGIARERRQMVVEAVEKGD